METTPIAQLESPEAFVAELAALRRAIPPEGPVQSGDSPEEIALGGALLRFRDLILDGGSGGPAVVDLCLTHEDEPELGLTELVAAQVSHMVEVDAEGYRDQVAYLLTYDYSQVSHEFLGWRPDFVADSLLAPLNDETITPEYALSLPLTWIVGITTESGDQRWSIGTANGTWDAISTLRSWAEMESDGR